MISHTYKVEFMLKGHKDLQSTELCAQSCIKAVEYVREYLDRAFGGGTIVNVWVGAPK